MKIQPINSLMGFDWHKSKSGDSSKFISFFKSLIKLTFGFGPTYNDFILMILRQAKGPLYDWSNWYSGLKDWYTQSRVKRKKRFFPGLVFLVLFSSKKPIILLRSTQTSDCIITIHPKVQQVCDNPWCNLWSRSKWSPLSFAQVKSVSRYLNHVDVE